MAGVIATIPKFQFSANGVPMVGGTLETYIAGSTTPATTWQDSALTIANTNPISLDARGECVLWLDSAIVYKFILKNALGVIQWTLDNIAGIPDLTVSTGATQVGNGGETVAQSFDALQLSDYAALRAYAGPRKSVYVTGHLVSAAPSGASGMFVRDDSDTTSADNGGTIVVTAGGKRYKRQGAVYFEHFGVKAVNADNSVQIQSAINAMSLAGGVLHGMSGKYDHASTIVLKKGVSIEGAGDGYASTNGTVFNYTGAGDGWQINNTINTSAPVHLTVRGVTFQALSLGVGKACFADTCSTLLHMEKCSFLFSAQGVGLIFDQTAVSSVHRCHFLAQGLGAGACLWLVNGANRNAGALGGFTNRITVSENQFNPYGTVGSAARGVLDEGGIDHKYRDNNFNGGSIQIQASGVNGLVIDGGEYEGFTSSAIQINGDKGASPIVSIANTFILVPSGLIGVNMAAAICDRLDYRNNLFDGAGVADAGIMAAATKVSASLNYSRGTGSRPINTAMLHPADSTGIVTLLGTSVAGANTYGAQTLNWRRQGDSVTFTAYLRLTAKDAVMAGGLEIEGLPFMAATGSANDFASASVAPFGGYTLAAGYTGIVAVIPPGTTRIRLHQAGSGQATAALAPAQITSAFEVIVSGTYLL